MSSPDFPMEIWRHIARFLSSDFIKTLYSVNLPFLHLALEARHRVIRVSDHETCSVRRMLLDEPARQWARVVIIDDGSERIPDFPRRFLLTQSLHHPRNQDGPTKLASKHYYDALMLVIRGLTQIREVTLQLFNPQIEQYAQRIYLARALLETAGRSLTKLDMQVGLEDLRQVLPTGPVLPQILHLRLVLRTSNGTMNTEILLLSVVLPFLVNHRSSLHLLELNGAPMVDLSILIQDLPHFPRLVKLYLTHHLASGSPQSRLGFNRFMTLHALQLREFGHCMCGGLVLNSHPRWFIDASDSTLLDFPQITHLTVSAGPRSGLLFREMGLRLERYHATLRSLRLQVGVMEYKDILDLLQSLKGSRALHTLNVRVDCLSPTVLGQFATNLPVLEDLTLNFTHTFGYISAASHSSIQSPLEVTSPEMVDRLKTWNLVSMTLVPAATRLELRMEIRRAIVAALPKVRLFCEVDPEEYGSAIDDPGSKFTGVQAFNFGERY